MILYDMFATDEDLVTALKRGDNDALELVYKTYWPMILRFVRCNSGSDDDGEELYQEGIIALYERLQHRDFRLTCSVKTYIYSICRNKWLHQLRGRKSVLDIEEYNEIAIESAEDEIRDFPDDDELMEVVEAMTDPCHSLLIGYYYQHLSLEVLADKLQYASANVAKQQKFRCIDKLKRFFMQKKYKYANE